MTDSGSSNTLKVLDDLPMLKDPICIAAFQGFTDRSGETVDASMFAAPVRIDRAVEGNIRRLVSGDDCARTLFLHLGFQRRQVFKRLPAIVETFTS